MKLTFVIPAYNAEKTICRCLDSVFMQTDGEWDAVVVDDGSKDATYEIMRSYAERDSRFVILTQKNQGPGMARNKGMKYATGEYIAFLDSDDYIELDYVSQIKKKIINDNLDVLILDNYYETPSGKLIHIEKLSKYIGLDKDRLIGLQMTGAMPWGGWRKVIKRDIINNNKIEYSCDTVGEEALFSFCVFFHANNIGFLNKPIVHYVNYSNSQSKKGDDDPWGKVVERLQLYLTENGLIDKYQKQLNSFAVTSLVVSLYRTSEQNNFFKATNLCREKIKIHKQKYSMDVDKSCLENRVRLLLLFVKLPLPIIVVLMSKIKKSFGSRNKTY